MRRNAKYAGPLTDAFLRKVIKTLVLKYIHLHHYHENRIRFYFDWPTFCYLSWIFEMLHWVASSNIVSSVWFENSRTPLKIIKNLACLCYDSRYYTQIHMLNMTDSAWNIHIFRFLCVFTDSEENRPHKQHIERKSDLLNIVVGITITSLIILFTMRANNNNTNFVHIFSLFSSPRSPLQFIVINIHIPAEMHVRFRLRDDCAWNRLRHQTADYQ